MTNTNIDKRHSAAALGAKTARACDSCLRCRARWYCAADDAFLCQSCDSSVHSANPLASRHERVRLKTASSLPKTAGGDGDAPAGDNLPAWLQGFCRKARTPRGGKTGSPAKPGPAVLVPDLAAEDHSIDDNEAQLIYRVPIFDPAVAEFRAASAASDYDVHLADDDSKPIVSNVSDSGATDFLPLNVDLADFAADVESLLGRGLDDGAFCMEGLGLMDTGRDDERRCFADGRVKVEEDEAEALSGCCEVDTDFDLSRDTLDLNFDYDSPMTPEGEEVKPLVAAVNEPRTNISLRLDYTAVIAAWASQGSPWTTGDRPHLNLEDSWPNCLGTCTSEFHPAVGTNAAVGDGGREARVSRYREKRRTRLFSKKIRYEVRKLNAEKRPRMKGRFVKRAPFAGPAFPF